MSGNYSIMVGTTGAGLFQSADSGESWRRIGSPFSGESQVRALAVDPRILVLDEATSSIDTETELQVQNGIKELIRGRTSIIIAHRLSTLKNVDKILVLKEGHVAEYGTQKELLQKKGIYWKLYNLQATNDDKL
jgi:ATP-binding cassette subfamily B protein